LSKNLSKLSKEKQERPHKRQKCELMNEKKHEHMNSTKARAQEKQNG